MSDTPDPRQAEADLAYANAAFIPGAADFPPRWAAAAAAFRASLGARARLNLPYGPSPAHRFDLFLPEGDPRGLLVFVHGGYWKAFGRQDWSHLAAGALGRGWVCAMPSYTLAPAARVSDMTAEVAQAIAVAVAQVPGAGPVCVAGHSAGGHLAARMACEDPAIPGLAGLRRVVPISPVADLAPLLDTTMNQTLRLTQAEVVAESPISWPLRDGIAAQVWVGGQERPAFLWQARRLSEVWSCPWTVDPGRHHFDVIEALADPASPLVRACLDGL